MANFIKGIDVSHYEPNIAWDHLLEQEIRFVYMKATQGTNYFDHFFPGYWAAAKEHGILRGAYHLLDPRLDGETQAKFFLDRTGTKYEPGDLPPVLDLEDFDDVDPTTGGQKGQRQMSRGRNASKARVTSTRDASSAQVIQCVEAWLRYVENNTTPKQTPILYSTADYFKSRLSNPATVPPSWASRYSVWVAHYPKVMNEDTLPLEAKGWSSWAFWQYNKNGLVNGITDQLGRLTGVDLNYFKGTLDELNALAGMAALVATADNIPQAGVLQELAEGKVVIPADAQPATMIVSGPQTYCIEPGDNLILIAAKFNTTQDAILAANPQIANPDFIRAGDNIILP